MVVTTCIRLVKISSIANKLEIIYCSNNLLKNHQNLFNLNHKKYFYLNSVEAKISSFVKSNYFSTKITNKSGNVNMFSLNDYDCIGFDLDNTVLRYNVANMVQMEYKVLSEYLVKQKGYSPTHLLKPLSENVDFLQKGLIMDFDGGNLLRISREGDVLRAAHGTKFLTEQEIIETYGKEKYWTIGQKFSDNILEAWNGPLSEKLRTLLDYFDMPVALAFGRLVDTIDEERGKQEIYNVWPDVLDGLIYMYSREHFDRNKSEYFEAMKCNPEKFVMKINENVKTWLKELKKVKTTFLMTGSHIDFANLTASYCMGTDWKDIFDVVICFARKPGFFTGNRPFVKLNNFHEIAPEDVQNLKIGVPYTQGNTMDLNAILKQKTNMNNPKILYIGDNLIQDIFTPSTISQWDTVAVVEELLAEDLTNNNSDIKIDDYLLVSKNWGSYFWCNGKRSFWYDIIINHSKICVPAIEILAAKPIDFKYKTFDETSTFSLDHGFYNV